MNKHLTEMPEKLSGWLQQSIPIRLELTIQRRGKNTKS